MEDNKRSLAKTVSWRGVAIAVTFIVIYFYTSELDSATFLTILLNSVKTVCFFVHERIWTEIKWGYKTEEK